MAVVQEGREVLPSSPGERPQRNKARERQPWTCRYEDTFARWAGDSVATAKVTQCCAWLIDGDPECEREKADPRRAVAWVVAIEQIIASFGVRLWSRWVFLARASCVVHEHVELW